MPASGKRRMKPRSDGTASARAGSKHDLGNKSNQVREFDPKTFLATIGEGRKIVRFEKDQTIFAQGNPTDAVFYVQDGKIKLSVVSKAGKEATIGVLVEGSFFGEGGLAGQAVHMGSATAMTDCTILRIDKKAMMQALHRERTF